MKEYIEFAPSPLNAFEFNPTLDGQSCTVIISWNLFGQRWYINIFDQNNNLILCRSLVSSPDEKDINLLSGYFNNTKLIFRESTQNFEVTN